MSGRRSESINHHTLSISTTITGSNYAPSLTASAVTLLSFLGESNGMRYVPVGRYHQITSPILQDCAWPPSYWASINFRPGQLIPSHNRQNPFHSGSNVIHIVEKRHYDETLLHSRLSTIQKAFQRQKGVGSPTPVITRIHPLTE